jgi:hypothetical protein
VKGDLKVMSLHEFVLVVKEEFLRAGDYLCHWAEHKFGKGAEIAMMKLVRERYPMWDYMTISSNQMLENNCFGLELTTEFDEVRLAFIERLLAQPDRRICWMET